MNVLWREVLNSLDDRDDNMYVGDFNLRKFFYECSEEAVVVGPASPLSKFRRD